MFNVWAAYEAALQKAKEDLIKRGKKNKTSGGGGAELDSILAKFAASASKRRKSLNGKALDKRLAEVDRTVQDKAWPFVCKVLTRFHSVDSWKPLESDCKELVAALKNCGDVYLDAQREEAAAEASGLECFIVQLKELGRCWKAYLHNFSDKTRGAFEKGWVDFFPTLRKMVSEVERSGSAPSPKDMLVQSLIFNVTHDLLKATIACYFNKEHFLEASKSLNASAICDQCKVGIDDVSKLQPEFMKEILKRVVRKWKDDTCQLTAQWQSVLRNAGELVSEEFCETVLHLSVCIDPKGKSAEEITAALQFIDIWKTSDTFIKSVSVLAAKSLAVVAKMWETEVKTDFAEQAQDREVSKLQDLSSELRHAMPSSLQQKIRELRAFGS